MANPITVTTRPLFEQANTNVHGAWDLRQSLASSPGAGVAGYQDFRVLQNPSGATMDVGVGSGSIFQEAWVRGSTIAAQGLYKVTTIDWTAPTADTYNAQMLVTVSAASATPRLDMVVLEIADNQHAGSTFLAQIRVVSGTATAGATLDNRTGAAAIPASSILLADILVPVGAASIVTADIRDRRAFPLPGVIPPIKTARDYVQIVPSRGVATADAMPIGHNDHDLRQSAALVFIPRRIVGVTRFSWRYIQGATAITGNYVLAIFDASGRLIVDTGAIAFAGAAGSYNEAELTVAATTFDAGAYYAFVGVDSATAGGGVYFNGITVGNSLLANSIGVTMRNSGLFSTTGGTTVPNNLLAFTDSAVNLTVTGIPPTPIFSLSVV